ncbi:MAG: hypothetical protein KAW12_26955 [Candidatus Aminicenantes bacterium]|nr:hypothetical protein [Candidatus Aminicenantes bacterium]
MSDSVKLKVVTNPMDFGLGFAAIVSINGHFYLVVLDKDGNVLKCKKYRSLRYAMRAFDNLYARRNGIKSEWSTEKIEYSIGRGRALFINGDGLDGVEKLKQLLKGSDYEKDKYYGEISGINFDNWED